MRVLEVLLADLPNGWQVEKVQIGVNWILAVVTSEGRQQAGLASAPPLLTPLSVPPSEAHSIAQWVLSEHQTEAAVGMAVLNALLQPTTFSPVDAADWLVSHSKDKQVAVIGRFPFVAEELEAAAQQVWVFEQAPHPGEYSAADMPAILPHAEIIAITSSTLVNHTIDDILRHILPHSILMLLGPSTPLSPRLFPLGFDLLSGVQVVDIPQALKSVEAGLSFRHMQGVARVTLCNEQRVQCP